MNFTLHTEPSVSPPEFTISIRTEGGPATHVKWTGPNGTFYGHDDHQTSQIIVNTSQNTVFENRLEVKGRMSGTYNYIIKISNEISFVKGHTDVMGLYISHHYTHKLIL